MQVKQFLQLERPVVAADQTPACSSSSTSSAPAQQSGLAASMAPAAAGQPLTATGDALPASSGALQKASASTLSGAATAAAAAAAVRSTGSTEGNTTGLCEKQLGVDSRSQTASAVGVDSRQMTAAVGVDCTNPAAADDTLEAFDEATSLQPGPACNGDARAPTQQQQQQQPWRQSHMHKYSVVWHDIYRVPVLYLAACRAGGWAIGVGRVYCCQPGLWYMPVCCPCQLACVSGKHAESAQLLRGGMQQVLTNSSTAATAQVAVEGSWSSWGWYCHVHVVSDPYL
jgi:hypothetical protein